MIPGVEKGIYGSSLGDLCPPYPGPPWPEGFIEAERDG